jgi:DNA-binding response OmpR family regulator
MPLRHVLAVGMNSSLLARLLTSQRSAWQSAGCIVTCAGSIREAIAQLRDGDFDSILLDDSLPMESRERLTLLIRASGSQIPVGCITESSGHNDSAGATHRNDPNHLLQVIKELLAKEAKTDAAMQPGKARSKAAAR